MADRVLTQKTALGQTFLNAMWIAGFLAFLQVAAVGYVIYSRSKTKPTVSEQPSTPSPVEVVSISTPPIPADDVSTKAIETNVIIPTELQNPALKNLNVPAPDLTIIDDPVGDIDDFVLYKLVEGGRIDRTQKNYDIALRNFTKAEKDLPEHPLVLSEIAGTLGEMGRVDEAAKYWTKVTALGPLVGGQYYDVSARMLNGKNPVAPRFQGGQILRLGKIQEQRLGKTAEGEKVVIRIPVFGNPNIKNIDVGKMNWSAIFYDHINDQTIGPSLAEVQDASPTTPYDWKDEVEELEVTYFRRTDNNRPTKRVYAGYGIKLFYDSELQDSVASSDEIGELMFSRYAPIAPGPNVDNSLFPK